MQGSQFARPLSADLFHKSSAGQRTLGQAVLIRQHPLQLVVLIFQRPQLFGLRHIHAAKLSFVFLESRITDAVATTQLLRLHTSLIFFDHSNDLFVRKSTFNSPSFAWADY